MLAIIPDYDESEDSSDSSGCEARGSNVESRDQNEAHTNSTEESSQEDVRSTDATRVDHPIDGRRHNLDALKMGAVDIGKITSDSSNSHASDLSGDVSGDISMSSGDLASTSGLSPEQQKSTLKFLALKRRKDEELRELEEAERQEGKSKARKRRGRKRKGGQSATETAVDGSARNDDSTEDMEKLSTYMGVNDHLRGALVDHGNLGPKSGLEKEIDKAVAEGDVDRAEHLSNYLASRNFGARVAEAANARDYAKQKQEEEERRLAKKKQKKAKLAWGFEVKHRWEMKGNM